MSTHTCPHDGRDMRPGETPYYYYCGTEGWLCPACREDRADRRNRELVEGLALAGVLANSNEGMVGLGEADVVRLARSLAAARREGGKG